MEEYLDNDEEDGAVKHDTNALANRSSFLVMRDRLKARGVDVRASLDMSSGPMMGGFGQPVAPIEQGCVILAVNDMFVVELFKREFAQLPGIILVPALGEAVTMQLVQQAASVGGCDFVLVHPDLLIDQR